MVHLRTCYMRGHGSPHWESLEWGCGRGKWVSWVHGQGAGLTPGEAGSALTSQKNSTWTGVSEVYRARVVVWAEAHVTWGEQAQQASGVPLSMTFTVFTVWNEEPRHRLSSWGVIWWSFLVKRLTLAAAQGADGRGKVGSGRKERSRKMRQEATALSRGRRRMVWVR